MLLERHTWLVDELEPSDDSAAVNAPPPAPRALKATVVALAILLELPLAGLVVLHVRPTWLSGLRNAPPAPIIAANSSQPTPVNASPTTAPAATTAPATLAAGPVMSAIEPPAGDAGQSVTIVGSGFFSTTGEVFATFEGHVVPTRCPTEQRCIATVPNSGRGETAEVQIHAAGSASNSLTFTYSTA